jgi:hypothetical protein
MQRLIAEPHQQSDWTRISPMFERPIYRHRTISDGAVAPPPDLAASAASQSSGQAGGGSSGSKPAQGERKSMQRPGSFNNPFAGLADLIKDEETS